MICPRCGAEGLPGNTFCHRCRARLSEPASDTSTATRPRAPSRRPSRRRRVLPALVLCALVALGAAVLLHLRGEQRRAATDEAHAVARLRLIVSAELNYGAANGGAFDTLECLAHPARCIPRLPADVPGFVDARLVEAASLPAYRLSFHAGPPPHERPDARRHSRSSLAAFAVVATPLAEAQGSQRRAFCADSTLRVCVLASTDAPELRDGVCPLLCINLGTPATAP